MSPAPGLSPQPPDAPAVGHVKLGFVVVRSGRSEWSPDRLSLSSRPWFSSHLDPDGGLEYFLRLSVSGYWRGAYSVIPL